jgi:hypothetical protein
VKSLYRGCVCREPSSPEHTSGRGLGIGLPSLQALGKDDWGGDEDMHGKLKESSAVHTEKISFP